MGKTLGQIVAPLLVFLLVGVFALQFGGQQAQGCASGGEIPYAVRVGSTILTGSDFFAVKSLADRARLQATDAGVLDGLVERTLLARAAEKLGFDVTPAEAMRRLAKEGTVLLTLDKWAGAVRVDLKGEDGNLSKDAVASFVEGLGLSLGGFTRWQVEEQLARQMRETVLASVQVSPRELWDAFVREQEQVTLQYVRFAPSYYEATLTIHPNELAAWTKEHKSELEKTYANLGDADGSPEEAKRQAAEDLFRTQKAQALADKGARDLLEALKGGASIEEAAPTPPPKESEQEVAETATAAEPPSLVETRPFGRGDRPVSGAFNPAPLVKTAFDLTADKPLHPEVLELGNERFVIVLKERTYADKADFTPEVKDRLREALLRNKQGETLELFVAKLQREAEKDEALEKNEQLIRVEPLVPEST